MFAAIKSLIPEPRHDDHPRGYVGRHRNHDAADETATIATASDPADEPASAEDRTPARDPQAPSAA